MSGLMFPFYPKREQLLGIFYASWPSMNPAGQKSGLCLVFPLNRGKMAVFGSGNPAWLDHIFRPQPQPVIKISPDAELRPQRVSYKQQEN